MLYKNLKTGHVWDVCAADIAARLQKDDNYAKVITLEKREADIPKDNAPEEGSVGYFNAMTKESLLAYAGEKGIELKTTTKTTKDEIIAMLMA